MQEMFLQIILPILLRGDVLQKDGQELDIIRKLSYLTTLKVS